MRHQLHPAPPLASPGVDHHKCPSEFLQEIAEEAEVCLCRSLLAGDFLLVAASVGEGSDPILTEPQSRLGAGGRSPKRS